MFTDKIRVKVLATLPKTTHLFPHMFPSGVTEWGNCTFIFDPEDSNYDWLVVYDDLPTRRGEPPSQRHEPLACPRSNTILTTSEPSSIKHFGNLYTSQFGHVITSQDAWALPHPSRIYSQAGLPWFYGVGSKGSIPFDQMLADPPVRKTGDLAMVFSPKRQWHTLHKRRFEFMRSMMQALPEMDVYGRGVKPLDDKAEAVAPYRYQIVIENFVGLHHWTEKLSDAFLGLSLPFYIGCTNAADYFPPTSFIPIDIDDPAGAVNIIRQAIADHEYEKRFPAIQEARRRVMYEHNYFALLSREIELRHDASVVADKPFGEIFSRHALRRQSPLNALKDIYGKGRALFVHKVLRLNH